MYSVHVQAMYIHYKLWHCPFYTVHRILVAQQYCHTTYARIVYWGCAPAAACTKLL